MDPRTTWIVFLRWQGLLSSSGDAPRAVVRNGQVWDANRSARRGGVRAGQALSLARTFCPDGLSTVSLEDARAADLLKGAWGLLSESCSVIEPDPDGRPEAYAAWTGASPPLPELRALFSRQVEVFPAADLAIGLGPNRLIARLVCPETGFAAVAQGGERRFMARQSLAVLGPLPRHLTHWLCGLRVHRCGPFLEIPESVLVARFGHSVHRWRAMCAGMDSDPVRSLYPPRALRTRLPLAEGVAKEFLGEAAEGLMRRMLGDLRPTEGAFCLTIRSGDVCHMRRWPSPKRGEVLVRAARCLAARVAREMRDAEAMEVELTDLAVRPFAPRDVWVEQREDLQRQATLQRLLSRFPENLLRRGAPVRDRHEAMLDLLDPWRLGVGADGARC